MLVGENTNSSLLLLLMMNTSSGGNGSIPLLYPPIAPTTITTTMTTFGVPSSSYEPLVMPSGSEMPPQIQRSTAELVEIFIYSLCLCIGAPLNLLSFHRLISSQFSRPSPSSPSSSTSSSPSYGAHLALLKLHLNIADLITMFVYTLSQIIWMIAYQWHAGDLLCRVIKFFHTFSFYLNSFVVACFAIDRFLGTRNLNNPSACTLAHARVKRMLVFAWLWAILLSLPQCFIFQVFEPSELKNFKQCTPIWTILGYELDLKMGTLDDNDLAGRQAIVGQFEQVLKWERIYNMGHLLFLFWIPSLIIAVSYASILVTLNSLSSVPERIRRTGASFRIRRKPSPRPAGSDEQNSLEEEERSLCGTPANERQPLRDRMDSTTTTATTGGGGGTNNGAAPARTLVTTATRNGSGGWNGARQSIGIVGALMDSFDLKNGGGMLVGSIAAQTIARARKNAKRQAALILAAYLTFWSPYNVLAMINAWAPKDGPIREFSSITMPFLNSLIVVNPLVNPLIYGVFGIGVNQRRK